LSQEQLALAAEVDRSYISEIELAKNSASIDVLERIADALDVDPKELFNERGSFCPNLRMSTQPPKPSAALHVSSQALK
jgi:transcriptional regulator with XRE-family HTH domain